MTHKAFKLHVWREQEGLAAIIYLQEHNKLRQGHKYNPVIIASGIQTGIVTCGLKLQNKSFRTLKFGQEDI